MCLAQESPHDYVGNRRLRNQRIFQVEIEIAGNSAAQLRVTIFPALHPKCCRQHFGCKIVVGTRLKRAGMHWTVKGANAIIALRCSKLSGRFQDFWERRSERKQVAA